jgi:mRNA-degrading endonuclease RelE of RelBE toxin-antitoxin system
MSARQITIKPTCMREVVAFPPDDAGLLWEKINYLVRDPLPDGKTKIKLKGSKNIYRLRVGDHRVFYQFGDSWVSLLGIRRRNEATYTDLPQSAGVGALPPPTNEDLDHALSNPPASQFTFKAKENGRKLPIPITDEWLDQIGVPKTARGALLQCGTEEDLLSLALPDEVLVRVLDAMFPPSLERVAQQPDLVVPSTQDLVRFKEGDLLGFLLRLDEEQKALTNWALTGPTMIRGGAGTGKSTVAMYRVKAVLERPGATGSERVLFTTYTRALLGASQQLLGQLLTSDQLRRVRVATCDQIAREIVASRRKVGGIEADSEGRQRLASIRQTYQPKAESAFEARIRARALARLSDAYLQEEFDWVITGRGLSSLSEYLQAPRPGRGVPFPDRLRTAVWGLYEVFRDTPHDERFPELRNEALGIVRHGQWNGHWDSVLVDEAQDLSPSALALMAEVCRTPQGLFFAADSKQSLYSRNYTWSSADPRLQFKGRTANLKRNYRSTAEIDTAALGLLRPQDEGAEPSTSIHEGPLPVLLRGVAVEEQGKWVARFIRQMAAHLHMQQSAAAVLVPNSDIGEAIASAVDAEGVPARFFPGRDLDLKAASVKVLTMHSAKGLEFPIVVVAGLEDGTYPTRDDFEDEGLYDERMSQERRLLYVALTRAMRGLMLVVPKGCRHQALMELDATHWHVEDV